MTPDPPVAQRRLWGVGIRRQALRVLWAIGAHVARPDMAHERAEIAAGVAQAAAVGVQADSMAGGPLSAISDRWVIGDRGYAISRLRNVVLA
ncbi:MAG: hypothetical protein ACO3MD_04590 [Candidatus Nanopelagicales bacterium]